MSMETLKFLLHEVHNVEELFKMERYSEYEKDGVDILLETAKSWADQDFYPSFREMDENPVYFKDGKVYSHPVLKKILKSAGEDGWLGTYFDVEDGGMNMPHMIVNSISHIFSAANNHISGYLGLTSGSAHLIASFGTQALKDKYVPKMLDGSWSGTMCLTEPQAGSSLSDITTTAIPQGDGTYKIKGQKIFISGGDHEASENFVHLTLARIEGAPAGTKGISLFAVPTKRITSDGGLEPNDVVTAGDFQKMGQKGYSTVHLVFGESNDCLGELVGVENKGLKHMFQMMNGARIEVGLTAASTAAAAYEASLQYAKERPQGRRIRDNGQKNVNDDQSLIIHHPDVRRMLMLQKSIVEGALSLLLEASKYHDISLAGSEEERTDAHLLLELLTPIAKTYPAEKGKEAIDNGLQVLGGYGFCTDFVLQQYYRDIRIMSIYEGTTGIQSLDLLARKVTMKNGAALQLLMQKIAEVSQEAMTYDDLKPYTEKLNKKLEKIQQVLAKLIPHAMEGNHELFIMDATIFMQMASTVVIGYQWLKMATTAKKALVTGNMSNDAAFYESKINTMKFFFKYELPEVNSCFETIMNDDVLTILDEKVEVFH